MVRITTNCGNQTLTIEVDAEKAKEYDDTPMTPFGCAVEAIKTANKRYEEDGNHFEYLSSVNFAMAQCAIESYKTLRKIAKYY